MPMSYSFKVINMSVVFCFLLVDLNFKLGSTCLGQLLTHIVEFTCANFASYQVSHTLDEEEMYGILVWSITF